MENKEKIPYNPYTLQPITKPAFLSGRSEELKTIEYYLNLTSSGQGNHLALIGERGVGKTSILNSTELVAVKNNLLPIRLQMNENIGHSPGRFWHELYSALTLAVAQIGGWGGLSGTIYEALFTMIHGRQRVKIEMAVLQFPYAMASHIGNIDDLMCSDALILSDFKTTVEELKRHNINGLALLIDEANCLGANRSLIQQFRNIFQLLENCSLVLAGTEAIFPTLTEVFSPIPRQFHRISVERFSHWSSSNDLVFRPFNSPPHSDFRELLPFTSATRRLHSLCGGSPSELQLYCHHMYKQIEEGRSKRMELHPQVYREVLNAYRSSIPSEIETVITGIEKLPDELLYKSSWLSRKNLNLEENIQVEVFRRALSIGRVVKEEEKLEISRKVEESYKTLFKTGITKGEKSLNLLGDSFTEGFWKSFVEVEKKETWIWNDNDLHSALFEELVDYITSNSESSFSKATFLEGSIDENDIVKTLIELRKGSKLKAMSENSILDLALTTIFAREDKSDSITVLYLKTSHENTSRIYRIQYLGSIGNQVEQEIEDFVSSNEEILNSFNITVQLIKVEDFIVPTNEEIQRIAYKSDVQIPDDWFGPSLYSKAIEKFSEGNTNETYRIFELMLNDKENPEVRNNLSFCYILDKKYDKALEHLKHILPDELQTKVDLSLADYQPLFDNNFGLLLFLTNNKNAAIPLERALSWIYEKKKADLDYNSLDDIAYVLLLNKNQKEVLAQPEIPLEVALLINLLNIKHINSDDAIIHLKTLYPQDFSNWLDFFN